MSEPAWDLLQSLHAVLQAGSFSAAARARGLTQPTLGRHIESLEQSLGAPLFLRSPRGLTPTDLAVSLRPHLEEMAAAAAAALRDASGAAKAGGVVRVTVSQMMGAEVIPEMLASFHDLHPEIDIELVLSDRNEDLSRREADIAVRMARPTQGSLIGKKVGVSGMGFYATPAYLERHGVPTEMEGLSEAHTLVGFDRDRPVLDALDGLDVPLEITRDLFAFRTDNHIAQAAAVRAGLGIGVMQHAIARKWGLTPVLANQFHFEMEVWVVMHENLKGSPRMRLMFDHLVTHLHDFVAAGR